MMSPAAWVMMVIVALILAALFLFFRLGKNTPAKEQWRPLKAFSLIEMAAREDWHPGERPHVGLGSGSIRGEGVAESMAGLSALDYMADHALKAEEWPLATAGNPELMLLAQHQLDRKAKLRQFDVDAHAAALWLGPANLPYAAGLLTLKPEHKLSGSIMLGSFSSEYPLLADAVEKQADLHIGGASSLDAAPFVFLTGDESLIGEDLFAGGAYLNQSRSHIASLQIQDALRWFIAGLIVVLALAGGLGLVG